MSDLYIPKMSDTIGETIQGLADNFNLLEDSLVEYGSNANGKYWRWENGLQICTKTVIINDLNITSPLGNLYYLPGGHSPGYYPAGFAQIPDKLVSIRGYNNLVVIVGEVVGGSATSVGNVYALRPSTTSNIDIQIEVFAIGRWK